ncbi:glutathione S-transferase 3-like isoform X2 [Babylonia areolata]
MPGIKYRLTYFPSKGRAELIRLIFHAARVPFEDRRISPADWQDLKPNTPTGTLPMLEINGEKFGESGAIANWAAYKFGLMGRTDAEQLKTQAILIQATDFGEKYISPLIMEQDPEKIEALKNLLEEGVDKMFTKWEASVVQTESTGRKVFSYMVTQCMTAADLVVLHVADLTEHHIKVDWARFPRLQAVIQTVSNIAHLKTYLTNRDNPDAVSTHKVATKSQSQTPRADTDMKQHTSPKSVAATPRAKGTPRIHTK